MSVDYVGLGQSLKQARTASGLSVQDLAEQIKYRPSQVEQVEAGNSNVFPSVLFLKGFVLAYFSVVGGDSSQALTFLSLPDPEPETDAVSSHEEKDGFVSSHRVEPLVKPAQAVVGGGSHLPLVIGGIVVILILLWVVGRYKKDEPSHDLALSGLASQAIDVSEGQSVTDVVVFQSSQALPSTLIVSKSSSPSPASGANALPLQVKKVSEHAAEVQSDTKLPALVKPSVLSYSSASVTSTARASQAMVSAPDVRLKNKMNGSGVSLGLTLSEDVWVEVVRDGKVLMSRVLKSSEQKQTFDFKMPFEVRVGKPQAVKLWLNDIEYRVSGSTQDKPVRFRVSGEVDSKASAAQINGSGKHTDTKE